MSENSNGEKSILSGVWVENTVKIEKVKKKKGEESRRTHQCVMGTRYGRMRQQGLIGGVLNIFEIQGVGTEGGRARYSDSTDTGHYIPDRDRQ